MKNPCHAIGAAATDQDGSPGAGEATWRGQASADHPAAQPQPAEPGFQHHAYPHLQHLYHQQVSLTDAAQPWLVSSTNMYKNIYLP